MKREYILGLAILVLVGFGLVVVLGDTGGTSVSSETKDADTYPYIEIVNPSGFVNTDNQPITIGEYVGKKVILLDILTYSCINCQRTFPYVTAWYDKYKDDGFIVIGIHTPEFVFEKDKTNVEEAMKKFGITFPVVLDNDYSTWNAYGNKFWPRKYLIDIHGNVVYDHIGEGGYKETEMKIRELLEERADVLGEANPFSDDSALAVSLITETKIKAGSPETYFGSDRNEYLANGRTFTAGTQTLVLPEHPKQNTLSLGGTWNIQPEYAEAGEGASIVFPFMAQDVYFVASGDDAEVSISIDGKQITPEASGVDVDTTKGTAIISEERLYHLFDNDSATAHELRIEVKQGILKAYTFTFG